MKLLSDQVVGIFSRGILRIPYLSEFLDLPVANVGAYKSYFVRALAAVFTPQLKRTRIAAFAGWGRRPTARKSMQQAASSGVPYLALEDGFLRSYGTGDRFPPLALVVDEQGIYYDSTQPSGLELLLQGPTDLLRGINEDVARAKALILAHQLSKYNHAPALDVSVLRVSDVQRVLVIDQTVGDMSVTLGGAGEDTFLAMLTAARSENPKATIYVKTHPEVSSGRKGGYLTHVENDEHTVVLREGINPLSLIERMDRVYVVTSTMGFEALLADKPVTVFGLPWYAGWGVTDDRLRCARRTQLRSVDALFAAAYFHYSRYLNPVTHQRGTIFDVIDWLVSQRGMAARYTGRMICIGFRRWKAANITAMLSLDQMRVVFVADVKAAERLGPQHGDCLVFWGRNPPTGLIDLAERHSARGLRMEDGFVRSVGLGSDLIRPMSLVLDERGIYFDPTQLSDLEHMLNTTFCSASEIARARHVRDFIVGHGITKYNLEPCEPAAWHNGDAEVVLVPGQVENDASIRYGCNDVNTNLGLLQAARRAHPDAFIVYKPHPDVASGNRAGKLRLIQAREFADHVETQLSVVSCIEGADVVHTMTSLTGFDALLRGKRVVVYGRPFYAGWGLTEDIFNDGAASARRARRLTLDELVAGTLLRYPLYWDQHLRGYTTCEAVLRRIVETRDALESDGGLERLRVGFVRRQWRKLGILTWSWLSRSHSVGDS